MVVWVPFESRLRCDVTSDCNTRPAVLGHRLLALLLCELRNRLISMAVMIRMNGAVVRATIRPPMFELSIPSRPPGAHWPDECAGGAIMASVARPAMSGSQQSGATRTVSLPAGGAG